MTMDRRTFLTTTSTVLATSALAGVRANAQSRGVVVEEVSLEEHAQKLAAGTITARALTDAYLRRIDQLDAKGPTLRSVIELNPDALAIAQALDDERKKTGKVRGPLHGIPILVKDNIDT